MRRVVWNDGDVGEEAGVHGLEDVVPISGIRRGGLARLRHNFRIAGEFDKLSGSVDALSGDAVLRVGRIL